VRRSCLMEDQNQSRWRAATKSMLVELHLVAQDHGGFLLDRRAHALTLDVVSSRRMTGAITLFDETWLRERLGAAHARCGHPGPRCARC